MDTLTATLAPSDAGTKGVTVAPSGAALAAEIRGVDLALPMSEDIRTLLQRAWTDHLVLLFRGQRLSAEAFIKAAEVFGQPREAGSRQYLLKGGARAAHLVSSHPLLTILSNLDENGNPVRENALLGSLEVEWHSDNSYTLVPPSASLLYAVEIPDDGSGNTSFNNQYQAYEELPADLKCAIAGREQVQDSSRDSAGLLRPGARLPATPAEVEGPAHPLVRIHPVTGKRALYLGRRRTWPSNYIVGMSNDDSERLLSRLWAHATQPHLAWTHVWDEGDLLIWDNRCCLHRRDEVNSTKRRVMHRTVLEGEPIVAG